MDHIELYYNILKICFEDNKHKSVNYENKIKYNTFSFLPVQVTITDMRTLFFLARILIISYIHVLFTAIRMQLNS